MKQVLVLAIAAAFPVLAGDFCNPRNFEGAYGFQLSGETTISGTAKPSVSVGNLTFQRDQDSSGTVSGTSSTQFAGYMLGNPVTGSYEAHNDCSLVWSLQDDSGNFQHFAGTVTPDFKRIQFRQSDPGTPNHGLMLKTPPSCTSAILKPAYRFSIAGSYTPMDVGQEAHKISASGTAVVDGGKLRLTSAGRSADGTIEVGSDCVVQMDLNVPAPDSDTPNQLKVRGMLVDGGTQILALQTDAGATVTVRFSPPQ